MKSSWICGFPGFAAALASCTSPSRAIDDPPPPPPSPRIITSDPAWTTTLMPLLPTLGLRGGDGVASHPIPNNRILWLFGDSWIGRVENGHYAPGAAMPNNVALVHAAPAHAGEHADDSTVQTSWGPSPKPGVYSGFVSHPDCTPQHAAWCWPCDGAVTLGPASHPTLAIFYADMARRVDNPKPGSPDDVWNFRFTGNRIALIDNPAEPIANWRITQHPLTPRDPARFTKGSPAISWGIVIMQNPGGHAGAQPISVHNGTPTTDSSEPELLVFGIDSSNNWDKLLMFARVHESQFTNFSAWQFRTAAPLDSPNAWSSKESDAAPIAHNAVDELTIHKQHFPATLTSPAHDSWLLIQGEPLLGAHILARTADSPFGPWSDGKPFYTIPEPTPPTDKHLITYGAKSHPHLSGPEDLLISYNINSTDFAEMARDVQIYRPRFIRVPLSMIDAK